MNIIHLPCSSSPLQSSCYFPEACVYIVRLHVRLPLLMVVHAVYSFLPEEEGAELRKRAASLTISSSQPVRHQFPCIYFVKH